MLPLRDEKGSLIVADCGGQGCCKFTYLLQASNDFIIQYCIGFYRSDEHLYRVLDECTKRRVCLLAAIHRKHTEIGTEIENESVAS